MYSSAHLAVERLHIRDTKIITPYDGVPRLLLPHLRHLSLSRTAVGLLDLTTNDIHTSSPTAYLEAAFPALASVTIDRSFQFESSGEVAPIALPARGHEGTCRSLRVDTTLLNDEGNPAIDWLARMPAFTALETLALTDPTNLLDLAPLLASPLQTLEVLLPENAAGPNASVDCIAWDLKIMSALLCDALGLKQLRRLVVSRIVDAQGRPLGDQRTREGLRAMAARLGVEVEETAFGPEGDVRRWEWTGLQC